MEGVVQAEMMLQSQLVQRTDTGGCPLKLLSHVRDHRQIDTPQRRAEKTKSIICFILKFHFKNIIGSKIVLGQLNVHMQNNKEQN